MPVEVAHAVVVNQFSGRPNSTFRGPRLLCGFSQGCLRVKRRADRTPLGSRRDVTDADARLMRTKDQVRRDVWKRMEPRASRASPGRSRIPNFAGAKLAAEKLAAWLLEARPVIKVNPDSPQTHVRRIGLEEERR